MKKTLSVFIAIMVCFTSSLYSQSGKWLWGRGNTGAGVDAYVTAADNEGNVYGAGIYGGPQAVRFGPLEIGDTASSGSLGSDVQGLWIKYDSSGNELWVRGTQYGEAAVVNIATDKKNNLIVFGFFDSPALKIGNVTLINAYGNTKVSQYFLAKYSSAGNLIWAICDGNLDGQYQNFFGTAILAIGGVTTDNDGNIFITSHFKIPSVTIGSYTLTNAGNSGTSDVFVAKYDSSGTLIWATSMGGKCDDQAFGIAVAATGNIYITGPFMSSSIPFGASIITNSNVTECHSSPPTPISYLAEFSPEGHPVWGRSIGGKLGAYSVGLVSDAFGSIYVAGGFKDSVIDLGGKNAVTVYPDNPPGIMSLFLVQYSTDNIAIWSKSISSNKSNLYGYSIGLAPCGQVWVCGNYSADANIDGHILPVAEGPDPVFFAGYNLKGGVIGYAGLGSGADDQIGISLDPKGNVFICGDYYTTGAHDAPFRIGSDTLTSSNRGGEFFYMAKYSNVVSTHDTNFSAKDISLCNAASAELTAPPGYDSVCWSDKTTSDKLVITSPGTYWVTCSSQCAIPTRLDTLHVQFVRSDTSRNSKTEPVCNTDATFVLKGEPGYSSYLWNTGDTTQYISPSSRTSYWVIERTGCDMNTLTIDLDMVNCDMQMPNAFTPNGDGLNDIYRPFGHLAQLQNYSFGIYNRFGQLVFYTKNSNGGWNGTFGNAPQDLGTFFYMISYKYNDKEHVISGDFQLIR